MKALLILTALLTIGCEETKDAPEAPRNRDRFQAQGYGFIGGENMMVITDTETGCQYLHADGYHSGAMSYMPGTCTENPATPKRRSPRHAK